MDVRELELALRSKIGDRVHYIGVYTSDNLPTVQYSIKPIIFIANTLKSSSDINIIGHWVAFYIEYYPSKRIIFFDSYGISPYRYPNKSFSQYINMYKKKKMVLYYTSRQLQPNLSIKCGLYVLLFIHYTTHYGLDNFIQYIHQFHSKNALSYNDKYVTRYYFKFLAKSKNCLEWKTKGKKAITYKECLSFLGMYFFSLCILLLLLYIYI